jgi:hypothetical protein
MASQRNWLEEYHTPVPPQIEMVEKGRKLRVLK